MSAIIKRSTPTATIVAPLSAVQYAAEPVLTDPLADAAADEIRSSRQELEALRKALRAAELAEVAARRSGHESGYAQGVRDGLAQAQTRGDEKAQALAATMAAALEQWKAKLDQMDRLAAALARATVEKLFDGVGPAIHWTEAAIARQVTTLGEQAIVKASVSPTEFSDDALSLLDQRLSKATVTRDPTLNSGQCCLTLQMGRLELNVAEHQAAILAKLDEFSGA